jgi:hypothetical protein
MKQCKTLLLLGAILMLAALTGCGPSFPSISYDETLLYGEWQEGTVHDVYKSDGSGYTWDTSDDIDESEASPFTWTLNNDQLLVTHTLWNGTVVPKMFTITSLNEKYLTYEDSYGNTHEYVRITPLL